MKLRLPAPVLSSWPQRRIAALHAERSKGWPDEVELEIKGRAPRGNFGLAVVVGSPGSGRSAAIASIWPDLRPLPEPDLDRSPIEAMQDLPRAELAPRSLTAAGLPHARAWVTPARFLSRTERAAAALGRGLIQGGVVLADPWEPERFDTPAARLAARRLRRFLNRYLKAGPLVMPLARRELLVDLDPDWILDTVTWTVADRVTLQRRAKPTLTFRVHRAQKADMGLRLGAHPCALDQPHDASFILTTGSNIPVGWCSWRLHRYRRQPTATLRYVMIEPLYRGFGLGADMMAAAAADLEDSGFVVRVSRGTAQLTRSLAASLAWIPVRRILGATDEGFRPYADATLSFIFSRSAPRVERVGDLKAARRSRAGPPAFLPGSGEGPRVWRPR